ncbi:sensor histidine kinase [Paenibacillus senegalensis]|uniref:sensor histidine kinase n=1 Tax=Paenibacillus senegalensis TaxID=1465766 RepID=UPI00028986D1|nr:HAMP domain-containing sensor histidine kinase [Paenibacillus senegalensis]
MIRRLLYTIRWKLLLLFFGSILLTIVATGLLLLIAAVIYQTKGPYPIYTLLVFLEQTIGAFFVIVITALVLFPIFFVLLSHRSIRYLGEITQAVQLIAGGQFDTRIPVGSRDELGELAENINRMAAQLKTSIEEERRAEQTKNDLITSVSHDLRTPLTSINGYLGLIEQDRYRDEVELRYYVNIAYEKAQRLTVMINDLFEYTRTRGGGIKLRKTEINLVDMLGQLAAHFRYHLEVAGMECRLFFPEERMVIQADGDKLVRVFENLILNGIHYGQDGKYIDIRVRRENKEVVVDIINYGEPIPEKDLPYIFERFYRVEKSRSEQTGGSGLGLAIAKTIVELHGGEISVYSDTTRTLFEVRLELWQGQAPERMTESH